MLFGESGSRRRSGLKLSLLLQVIVRFDDEDGREEGGVVGPSLKSPSPKFPAPKDPSPLDAGVVEMVGNGVVGGVEVELVDVKVELVDVKVELVDVKVELVVVKVELVGVEVELVGVEVELVGVEVELVGVEEEDAAGEASFSFFCRAEDAHAKRYLFFGIGITT